MRSLKIEFLQHAHDLGELGHEVRLILQASSRVDDEHVEFLGVGPL